jgi:hypothetical protein
MRMPHLWGISPRTARLLIFDLMRLRARLLRGRRRKAPASDKLHLGCGTRKVARLDQRRRLGIRIRVTEADVLARFPEFLVRGDDVQSLYVRAQ